MTILRKKQPEQKKILTCGCEPYVDKMVGGRAFRDCIGHGSQGKLMEPQPDLSNRQARCSCMKITASTGSMAFFRYRPNHEFDEYYCGHAGWD